MIDKLVLLTPTIAWKFRKLAIERGIRRFGYRQVINLGATPNGLPIMLYCSGLRNGIHKVEVVGVARLGLRQTHNILREVIPDLSEAKIYRIDFCLDLLGVSVSNLAEACFVRGVQNYRIYRRRGALSYYLQVSGHKVIVLYDKGKEVVAKRNPLALILRPGDAFTRVEVQLRGPVVAFKKLHNIRRYGDLDLLGNMSFNRLRPFPKPDRPMQFLAATGLRYLIRERGLQAVAKMFGSSEWAFLKAKFLEPSNLDGLPDLNTLLKKSLDDWLNNRIRFPRAPERKYSL